MTDTFEKTGSLPLEPPVCTENGIVLYTDERNAQALRRAGASSTLQSWLKAHFARLDSDDYFASLRTSMSAQRGLRRYKDFAQQCATASSLQPRCNSGRAFCTRPDRPIRADRIRVCSSQITAEPNPDLDIPGRKASFGVIEAAQARGDFRVLAERDRRVLHAHITGDVDTGLAAISEAALRALR